MGFVYRRPFDVRVCGNLSPAIFAAAGAEFVAIGAVAVSPGGQELKANHGILVALVSVGAVGQALSVIGSEIVQIAAAAVSVSGRAVSLAGRWALHVRRLFVSLNDING